MDTKRTTKLQANSPELNKTCNCDSLLVYSAAAALTDFKSARSNFKNEASFPVSFFRSWMASCAREGVLAAMYTLALWMSSSCERTPLKAAMT
jgi:hypothetical protein